MRDRAYANAKTQQKTLSMSSPSSGLLQRTCACGQHTIAGGECSTCRNQRSTLRRAQRAFGPPSTPIAVLGNSPSEANGPLFNSTSDRTPRFGYDFSQIPIHSPTAGVIQTKLAINQPGDQYEQEADRISEQVMRMPEPQLQCACASVGVCPKCQTEQPNQEYESLQTKRVQASDTGQIAAPPIVHEVLRSPGQPLDLEVRAFMETRFGYDFSRVRVHSGAAAEFSARELSASAYTVGHDLVFSAGKFAPQTHAGRKLLIHELTHVVQQSAAQELPGGKAPPQIGTRHDTSVSSNLGKPTHGQQAKSVPVVQRQLAPKPAPKPSDPLDELGKIVAGKDPRRKLKEWLEAHPLNLSVAETFLLERAKTSTSEKEWGVIGDLLVEVFARDPSAGIARMRLRNEAQTKTKQVWEQYSSAAAITAIHQWASNPKERTRIISKLTTQEEQTTKMKELDELRIESEKLLEQMRKDRVALVKEMQHSLLVLPLSVRAIDIPSLKKTIATGPLFAKEEELVAHLLHTMERGIAHAEGIHLQSYKDYTTRTPEGDVVAEIAGLNRQRDVAEAGLKAANKELEDAKKLTGSNATAKVVVAKAKVKRAQDRMNAAVLARTKASPAATRTLKFQEDPKERQRIDSILAQAGGLRTAFLKDRAAKLVTFKPSLLDEAASWWIYWHSITNARDGFEGFEMEHTLRPLLLARNKMITAPRSTGIDADTSPDTYAGHGWGQYDLNAPAGTAVRAVQPLEIDLSQVLGGQNRMFEWVGSRVSSVFGQDPRQTEKDVLDKLAYGFFGRDREFERKIEETELDTGSLPKRGAPEPNRLVAGLLYRRTVEGSELEIEPRLVQLRADLEQLLEGSPEFAGLRVDENQEILREPFEASTGDFGTAKLLNPDAFLAAGSKDGIPPKVIKAFNTSISRILKEDSDFTQAIFTLLKERVAHLKATGGVEAGHKRVLDWAGPSVFIVHHYREKGGVEEVWIRVIYLHLHKVSAKITKESKDPLSVGQAGSGGNAISPHVHMSIAVFRKEPQWNTPPIDYIDPTDFFGMVQRTPFKTAKP